MNINDQQLIQDYLELKSIWKVAEKHGIHGQTVCNKLNKYNIIDNKRWHKEEINKLKQLYIQYNGDIEYIVTLFPNRTYASIACKANEIGITNLCRKNNPKTFEKASKSKKEWHQNNNHPRGMLGKNHSLETRKKMSQNHIGIKMPEETKQKLSNLFAGKKKGYNTYSRCRRGYYNINGKEMFFRSSWEPIYAQYLELLASIGAIVSWEYEPDTFWFENIKRGIRSYTPDFKVLHLDGSIEYHEIKGWMDKKSITKLKRMKKYYPHIKLIVISEKDFYALKKKWSLKPIYPIDKKQ